MPSTSVQEDMDRPVAPWKIDVRQGLPPDGERHRYLGFDAMWRAYILKWSDRHNAWCAVGMQTVPADKNEAEPIAHRLREENRALIVKWMPLPLADDEGQAPSGAVIQNKEDPHE